MSQVFRKLFSVDLRSLAFMRILIGLVVLTDLCIRISDLQMFYTDGGILSRSMLQNPDYEFTNPYFFSLLNISGHWLIVLVFYIFAFISTIHLIVGYRTKWFTFLCWLLLLSIQNRNPFILQGGDGYLRLILFWGIFLPWGKRFSVDALKSNHNEEGHQHFSIASIAYLLQVISLYLYTALLKSGDEWRSSFEALYYALSLDQLVKPIGKMLLPYEDLLTVLTQITIYTEFLIPILLIIPYKTDFFRSVVLILLIGLHGSIELMMQVGLFSFISLAAASALTPGTFIKWLSKKGIRIKRFIEQFFEKYKTLMLKIPKLKIDFDYKENRLFKLGRGIMLILFIVIGAIWNVSTISSIPPVISKVIDPIGASMRLDQHWGMFAPVVFKDDGWYVNEAYSNGKIIDLYTYPDSISYEKPKYAVRQFKNARWRKLGENLIFVDNIPLRITYCDYLIQKWNKKHHDLQLDSLKIVYMMEPTEPNYQAPTISREELCTCIFE